jgi:hypothetical protein
MCFKISSQLCIYIYSPDTFIYSIADQNGFLIPQSKVNFVLNNNGSIFWPNPLTQLKVRCRMNILWVNIFLYGNESLYN